MGTEAFLKPTMEKLFFCLCVQVTLPRRHRPWLPVPFLHPMLTLLVPTEHVTQGWSDKGWGGCWGLPGVSRGGFQHLLWPEVAPARPRAELAHEQGKEHAPHIGNNSHTPVPA